VATATARRHNTPNASFMELSRLDGNDGLVLGVVIQRYECNCLITVGLPQLRCPIRSALCGRKTAWVTGSGSIDLHPACALNELSLLCNHAVAIIPLLSPRDFAGEFAVRDSHQICLLPYSECI
jgi:hypothetical protein